MVDHQVARHIIFDNFILNAAKCLGNNVIGFFSDLDGTLLNLQRSKKLTTPGVTNPVMGEYLWVRIFMTLQLNSIPGKRL